MGGAGVQQGSDEDLGGSFHERILSEWKGMSMGIGRGVVLVRLLMVGGDLRADTANCGRIRLNAA
jgi:hypothetical protein